MEKINIQFTLFSAFYSPLISMMSGGFLKAENNVNWMLILAKDPLTFS